MPELLNGEWVASEVAANEMKNGAFHREPTRFRDWVGQDGLPAEADRYHLYVSYLCPWASRTLAFRKLKGLEAIIGLTVSEPELGKDGWVYAEPEPNEGFRYHHQFYTASDPHYTGKVSVPILWDKKERRIVNNESADIIRMFNSAFDELTGNTLDFYPQALQSSIDRWNDLIYENVNNGVYKTGFAKSQTAYEAAFDTLFETLDHLESHLSKSRYLAGEWLTEADWRLFVTLVRFDAAYFGQFKCNLRRIADYPALSHYLRELYQWPGIRETVRIDHIKRGYYGIAHINPTGIIPKGPDLDLDQPHNRETLRGQGVYLKS